MDYIRDISEFNYALTLSEDLLSRDYLKHLKSMPLSSINDIKNKYSVRLIKMYPISKSCSSHLIERVIPTLNALHHLKVSIGYILQITPCHVNAYLAVKSSYDIDTVIKLIQSALEPIRFDVIMKILDENLSNKLLNQSLFTPFKVSSLSSVTLSVDTYHNIVKTNTSKLKEFMHHMSGETFTILFLAHAADQAQISNRITQLEGLFTLLDSFKETNFTYHKTSSDSCTNTTSDTKFKSLLHTDSLTNTKNIAKKLSTRTLDSLIVNLKINDSLNYILNTQPSKEKEFKDIWTTCDAQTDTKQNTFTDVKSNSETSTKGNNATFSFKGENKAAIELLKKTDASLTKLYGLQHLPTFNLGVYFASPHAHTTLRATFTYLELLANSEKCLHEHYVNTWDKDESTFNTLLSHLCMLSHPSFIKGRKQASFTPTTFVDYQSLAHLICAPTVISIN